MDKRYLISFCFLVLGIQVWGQTGPGGVGSDDGTSILKVWYKVDNGLSISGGRVDAWANSAGIPALDISETGTQRPTRVTNSVNGYSEVSFDGSNRLRTGLTLTTSNFVVNEASSFVVSQADNTTQTSSVYLTDPLDGGARFSNHIPWAGNVYFDIGVCCGDDGRLEVGGLTGLTNYSVWSYDAHSTTGKQLYRNGSLLLSRPNTSTYTGHAAHRFNIGGNTTGSAGFVGDVAEVIVFNSKINSAQRIIIQNYLAAKYGLTLSANDVYTMDDSGNGHYDYEVAGIGRVDASNMHATARGSGIVTVTNASGLGNGEYFMWGHDNGALQASVTTGLPSGVTARFARQWRVSEVGEVGSVDLEFDLNGISDFASMDECAIALSLRLLIDSDGDGYADQTPIVGATHIGSGVYRFANVNGINNSMRFTLGIYNPSVDGPGGVGGTNGASPLVLWLDANRVSGANGSTITTWSDASGYGNHFTIGNGAVLNTSGGNGYPAFVFNGTSHYFERPFSASLMPSAFTIMTANNVSSSGNYKAVISNRDDPAGNETRGYMLYSVPGGNEWEFWNGHATIAWQRVIGTSTAGNWAGVTASYRSGAAGKNLYVNSILAGSDNHALNPNTLQPVRVGAGQNESTPNFYFEGRIGEIIMYNRTLNDVERIIVDNYLASKYGYSISNDQYAQDSPGNGNFDHDVAGIGRTGGVSHSDSRGTGIVRVLNPTDLTSNGEWFFWGHNGADIEAINETDVPAGIQRRLSRVWRISENGNVGSVDLYFDMTGMGPVTVTDLRLLVDNNGVFATGGIAQYSAVAMACNQYAFLNIPGGGMNGNYFTLGTVNSSQTPLPIELRSFAGEMVDGEAHLKWVTATETNNHLFTIERSLDGKNFRAVGETPGAGTTLEQKSYEFVDHYPPPGVVYYRLRQTDFDGAYSYSDVIRLESEETGTRLTAAPNPVDDGTALVLRIHDRELVDMRFVRIRVFDTMGREVPVTTNEKGQDTVLVRFAEGQTGLYLITADSPQLSAPLMTRVIKR